MGENAVYRGHSPESVNGRRFNRAPLKLRGRYLAPDSDEHDCETVDVSPTGVRLRAPRTPTPGSQVVVYLDELGRLEGAVVRTVSDGFAIAIRCTARKYGRLAHKINWLMQRNGAVERRGNPRFDPEGAYPVMVSGAGSEHVVELLDVSETGVAFLTQRKLRIGERIELGLQKAAVTRLFEGGAAATFI